MLIKSLDTITPIITDHGDAIKEILGQDDISIAHMTLLPGSKDAAHYHPDIIEAYFILSGTGAMHIDDKSQSVKPNDAILVRKNKIHYIENTGDTDLMFLAICSPAWHPDCSVFVKDN